MAKSNIDARKLAVRLSQLARKALENPKLANRLKNKITLNIKKMEKLPSGDKVPDISEGWRRRRAVLSNINKTDRFFSNSRSNMTFTGQFLKSFKGVIQRFGKSVKLIVYPDGIHKGYEQVYGGRSDSVFNADIGRGFIDRGVDYRVISGETRKELAKSAKAAIIKEFKLNLRK
jgi:hypothetical protein